MRRKRKAKKEREESFREGKDKAHREEKNGEEKFTMKEKWWRQWTDNSVNKQQVALYQMFEEKEYHWVLQNQLTQAPTASLKSDFIIPF